MKKILLPIVLVLFASQVFGEAKETANIRKAAEAGDAAAQSCLGWAYANGTGVLKDDKEAAKWYRKAADQGYADAQFLLGNMYHNGEGVPQDHKEAVKWYRKAAEQGDPNAQDSLGLMYANGEGVLKDDVAAFVWFNLAAFNGAEDGPKARDSLAKEMTLAQIAEAKKLTKELLKKVEANKKKE